jgi:acetyl esterase/lipase
MPKTPADSKLQFLSKNPLPAMEINGIEAMRAGGDAFSERMFAALGDVPAGVKISEAVYTTEDGTTMDARIYQPAGSTRPKSSSPLVVWYFGGGFIRGSPKDAEEACRSYVLEFGCVCVAPSYRVAPEHPFPTAITDAFDALSWAVKNAANWGADPFEGFVIAGPSAGANVAAAVTLLARDAGMHPMPTGQHLVIPQTTHPNAVPEQHKPYYLAHEDNKNAPAFTGAFVDFILKTYNPDPHDPRFNILAHPSGHRNLPRTVVYVDGLDPLRDDGIIYERVLRESGVETKLFVYPGVPHGHWGWFGFLKASEQYKRDDIEGMRFLLQKTA